MSSQDAIMTSFLSLSIIIPVLNEGAIIQTFLAELRARATGAEIIVVDGGSIDQTRDLAAQVCDRLILTDRGRSRQMNAGAAIASGNILWFLHADCQVPADCTRLIASALRNPETVGGFFRIRIPRREFVYRFTDSFAHYAGLLLRMRFGDHGFFCRRTVFEEIGGFPDVPLMEDAEFFTKLRAAGRVAVLPSPLLVSPRRYAEIGAMRLTLAYGFIAILYALGVRPRILAALYQRTCTRRHHESQRHAS